MEHVFRLVLTPISQAKNYTVEILCTLTKDYTQLLHSLVTTLTIDYNNYVICVCISRPCTITFMKKFFGKLHLSFCSSIGSWWWNLQIVLMVSTFDHELNHQPHPNSDDAWLNVRSPNNTSFQCLLSSFFVGLERTEISVVWCCPCLK